MRHLLALIFLVSFSLGQVFASDICETILSTIETDMQDPETYYLLGIEGSPYGVVILRSIDRGSDATQFYYNYDELKVGADLSASLTSRVDTPTGDCELNIFSYKDSSQEGSLSTKFKVGVNEGKVTSAQAGVGVKKTNSSQLEYDLNLMKQGYYE